MGLSKHNTRAFVLGGGGARGALQVGALRALLETDVHTDLLVGTSVGAVNASYLAVRGFTEKGLDALEDAWRDAAKADLLPANYWWLIVRTLFDRARTGAEQRIRDFFVDQGLEPELRFGEIEGPRLILVAADLETQEAVLYGTDPNHSVLDGLLASIALPPWVRPLTQGGSVLIDGGFVSNLPIEPALTHGATEIVALDLVDPRPVGPVAHALGWFLVQMRNTVKTRQTYLEKQLAAAKGVPVYHVELQPESPTATWEFIRAEELFQLGYSQTRCYLAMHPELGDSGVPAWKRWRHQLRLSLLSRAASPSRRGHGTAEDPTGTMRLAADGRLTGQPKE